MYLFIDKIRREMGSMPILHMFMIYYLWSLYLQYSICMVFVWYGNIDIHIGIVNQRRMRCPLLEAGRALQFFALVFRHYQAGLDINTSTAAAYAAYDSRFGVFIILFDFHFWI